MSPHKPYSSILVAVDPEKRSTAALTRALDLAQRTGARLHVVHGVEIPPTLWPGLDEHELAAMHASALAHARERMLAHLHDVLGPRSLEARLDERLSVHPGHPARVILSTASEIGADLIVVGPHDKRSVFDFGSTVRAVLAQASCSIWRQGEPCEAVESILVPVDFSEHSRRALEHAYVLARGLGARVRVLHCYTPPAFAYANVGEAHVGPTYVVESELQEVGRKLERWMEEMRWEGVEAESELVQGLAADQVVSEAEHEDLVVMGTHGRTGLARFLMGSTAHRVLARAPKPVVVVPGAGGAWLLGEGASA